MEFLKDLKRNLKSASPDFVRPRELTASLSRQGERSNEDHAAFKAVRAYGRRVYRNVSDESIRESMIHHNAMYHTNEKRMLEEKPFEVACILLDKLIWYHMQDGQHPHREEWFGNKNMTNLIKFLMEASHSNQDDGFAFIYDSNTRGIISWNEYTQQTVNYNHYTSSPITKIRHCMKVILSRILGQEIDLSSPRLERKEWASVPDLRSVNNNYENMIKVWREHKKEAFKEGSKELIFEDTRPQVDMAEYYKAQAAAYARMAMGQEQERGR